MRIFSSIRKQKLESYFNENYNKDTNELTINDKTYTLNTSYFKKSERISGNDIFLLAPSFNQALAIEILDDMNVHPSYITFDNGTYGIRDIQKERSYVTKTDKLDMAIDCANFVSTFPIEYADFIPILKTYFYEHDILVKTDEENTKKELEKKKDNSLLKFISNPLNQIMRKSSNNTNQITYRTGTRSSRDQKKEIKKDYIYIQKDETNLSNSLVYIFLVDEYFTFEVKKDNLSKTEIIDIIEKLKLPSLETMLVYYSNLNKKRKRKRTEQSTKDEFDQDINDEEANKISYEEAKKSLIQIMEQNHYKKKDITKNEFLYIQLNLDGIEIEIPVNQEIKFRTKYKDIYRDFSSLIKKQCLNESVSASIKENKNLDIKNLYETVSLIAITSIYNDFKKISENKDKIKSKILSYIIEKNIISYDKFLNYLNEIGKIEIKENFYSFKEKKTCYKIELKEFYFQKEFIQLNKIEKLHLLNEQNISFDSIEEITSKTEYRLIDVFHTILNLTDGRTRDLIKDEETEEFQEDILLEQIIKVFDNKTEDYNNRIEEKRIIEELISDDNIRDEVFNGLLYLNKESIQSLQMLKNKYKEKEINNANKREREREEEEKKDRENKNKEAKENKIKEANEVKENRIKEANEEFKEEKLKEILEKIKKSYDKKIETIEKDYNNKITRIEKNYNKNIEIIEKKTKRFEKDYNTNVHQFIDFLLKKNKSISDFKDTAILKTFRESIINSKSTFDSYIIDGKINFERYSERKQYKEEIRILRTKTLLDVLHHIDFPDKYKKIIENIYPQEELDNNYIFLFKVLRLNNEFYKSNKINQLVKKYKDIKEKQDNFHDISNPTPRLKNITNQILYNCKECIPKYIEMYKGKNRGARYEVFKDHREDILKDLSKEINSSENTEEYKKRLKKCYKLVDSLNFTNKKKEEEVISKALSQNYLNFPEEILNLYQKTESYIKDKEQSDQYFIRDLSIRFVSSFTFGNFKYFLSDINIDEILRIFYLLTSKYTFYKSPDEKGNFSNSKEELNLMQNIKNTLCLIKEKIKKTSEYLFFFKSYRIWIEQGLFEIDFDSDINEISNIFFTDEINKNIFSKDEKDEIDENIIIRERNSLNGRANTLFSPKKYKESLITYVSYLNLLLKRLELEDYEIMSRIEILEESIIKKSKEAEENDSLKPFSFKKHFLNKMKKTDLNKTFKDLINLIVIKYNRELVHTYKEKGMIYDL